MKREFVAAKTGILSVVLASALLLGGCGSSSNYKAADSYGYAEEAVAYSDYDNYDYEESMVATELESSTGGSSQAGEVKESAQSTQRKLIRTLNISAETKEYKSLVSSVLTKVDELGGYVEASSENVDTYREPQIHYASFTLRIPAARANEMVTMMENQSNIINRSESTEDVTLTYVDIKSRKESLETEQKRLLEMMSQAETMEDMILLEDKLSNIRYEIQSIESQLRTYDNKVDYTTIYLSITEVRELTPVVTEEKTYFERVGEGFVESLVAVGTGIVNFIGDVIIAIPYLIIWAIVIFVLFKIGKKIFKKYATEEGKAKRAEKEAQKKAEKQAKLDAKRAATREALAKSVRNKAVHEQVTEESTSASENAEEANGESTEE